MSLQDKIEILRKVELFSEFNSEQLSLIAFTSKRMNYLPEVEVFHEGQSASGGYAIMEGSVELFQNRNKGAVSLGVFEPGSLLSELSLITPNKRRTSAKTVTDTVLLSMPRSVILRVLSEYPQLAVGIKTRIEKSITSLVRDMEHVPAKFSQG